MNRPDISICVITYKRPACLKNLLESLVLQSLGLSRFEIIVVDNDRHASSKTVVENFAKDHGDVFVSYNVEPVQGIPLARNRSVKLARGHYVAFIDDDEIANPSWLEALYQCLVTYQADAVFGPVEPILPPDSPDWLKKGTFYDRPHHQDGTSVVMKDTRTGNALVRKKWLDRYENPFDPNLRFTGGSDSDLFARMLEQGAKLCWSEHATVYEFVDRERLKLKWLLMRAFRGGQGYAARSLLRRHLLGKILHLLYRFILVSLSLVMVIVSFPFGRHRSVWWLRKVFSNAGQISVFLPFRYEEYKALNYR